jgi:hypothetical protein
MGRYNAKWIYPGCSVSSNSVSGQRSLGMTAKIFRDCLLPNLNGVRRTGRSPAMTEQFYCSQLPRSAEYDSAIGQGGDPTENGCSTGHRIAVRFPEPCSLTRCPNESGMFVVQERAWFSQVLLAAVLLTHAAASAEDAFSARWRQLRAHQASGAKLVISAAKTTFFLGETIPLQLTFTATRLKTFLTDTQQYDRVGRMNHVEQFIVDPASFAEDPLRGLPGEDGGMGGLSGGPLILSEKPFSFERILNEWVRFRKPGRYRVYVLSHRVSQTSQADHSDYYLRLYARGTPVEIASNILTIEIRPAPASWVKEQIVAATRILDAPVTSGDEAAKERIRAGRILRFLDTPEAATELAKHLSAGQDVDAYALHMGVLGSPHRKQLLPLLEQRLVAPDQPVWDRYLDTLAFLAELAASGGLMPPYPKDEQERKTWVEESKRRTELREQKRNAYASRLFASLAPKQPQAQAISVNTLLDSATRYGSEPPWFPNIVASLIANFRNLPIMTQRDLLEYRWTTIKRPEIIPVLHDLYAKPPEPQIDPPIEDIALR